MATLSPAGRIAEDVVEAESQRLRTAWTTRAGDGAEAAEDLCARILGESRSGELDRFDRVQLSDVLTVCRRSRSISEAGRELFAQSRQKKSSGNDADRLRKYLARFGVAWAEIQTGAGG